MRGNGKPHLRGTEGYGNQGGGVQERKDPAVNKAAVAGTGTGGTKNSGDVTGSGDPFGTGQHNRLHTGYHDGGSKG